MDRLIAYDSIGLDLGMMRHRPAPVDAFRLS
jgi:hypothetical protein